MREMKDSGIEWVGAIPATWQMHPLYYYFCERKCRNTLGKENNLLSLSYGRVIRKDINTVDGLLPENYNGYNIIEKDDIVLRLTDLQNDKRSLRTGLVREHGIITSAYTTIKANRELVPEFFQYLLHSYDAMKVLYNMGSGVRQGLNFSELSKMPLISPDMLEQKKIADFLDAKCSEIDAISADIQKEIKTLEQYKRSVITEAVTKGLNPDAEMKDSGIEWVGNVPAHWDVLANKYVMKKRKDICTKWNGENVLSLTMNGVIVRDLDNPVGKMPTTFDGYQFVYRGNLLMCLFDYDVTPRCVGIVKNAGVTSPAYSRFELKENATLEYFYYYYLMIDFTKELLHLAKNLRHSFTEEQLGALKVPLPPLDEQKNIATYLDSKCKEIEFVIASKKQQLTVIDSYKKSLIYEYVTGKKEVPLYES